MNRRSLLEVIRAGALTTIQDLGRPGFAASGVPRGGAMDPWAARAANRAVGNPDDAAVLEITLAGPTLLAHAPTLLAIVGDPFEVDLEGSGAGEASLFALRARSRISIGRARSGARAWIAVAGGFDLPRILGSRSTDLAGGFGGLAGRPLVVGDRLPVLAAPETPGPRARPPMPPPAATRPGEATRLRTLAGPDVRLLGSEAASGPYRVDPRSDRRGVRLTGCRSTIARHPPLRSQPVLPGTVQAPSADELIVLGPDAPVTGGYPWVAQVIAADLGLLGRLAPGAEVRFERVDWAEAERALEDRWRALAGGERA